MGKLVLIINQLPNEQYIQKMLNYIYNNINDLHYLGVIGYSDSQLKNPQPMWIWKKSNDIPEELYNPPIKITNHNIIIKNSKIKYNVFQG